MNLNHKQATAMLLATSYFIVLFTASLSRAAVIVAPPPSPTSISQAGPQADLALANESPTSRSSQDPQQQQQSQSTQMTSSNQLMGEMSQAQQQQQQQQTVMSNSIGTAHSSQMVSSPTSGGSPPMSPMGGQQPLRLPRINIYASRSEVKKLLGIDTSINYVTNGQLNTYPLGFTIPMGYHLSDMIFTWQNLGPTNVNYSISLVIGNIQAVDRPLINITRSGLIPHHEQVFKITLPCSGRLTDEVDVQVLINIMGLVPVASASNGQLVDGDLYGAGGESAVATQQASAELARAVQQQTELLTAAQANSSTGQNGAEQMQADEANGRLGGVQPKQPQMRMVSHTIAIKRKKICTQHPVPVQPALRPNEVRPPNQLPAGYVPPSAPLQQTNDANKWPSANSALDQQSTTTTTTTTSDYQPQAPTPAPLAEPAHQPAWSTVGGSSSTQDPSSTPSGNLEADQASLSPPIQQQQPMRFASSTGAIGKHPINKQQPSVNPNHNWPMSRLHIQHQQTTTSSSATNQQRQVQDSAGTNPLIELLQQQQPAGNTQQQAQQPGANPLISLLVAMSLIISIALVALLILGSTSAQVGPSYRRHPMDKLSALTNCIWRRTSAGSRAVNKCTKNVGPITIKNGIIGTFAGPTSTTIRPSHVTGSGHKSTVSSLSGLSTISGLNNKQNHHQTRASFSNSLIGGGSPYYYKQQQQQQQHANYTTGPYYHHYQHLPDLLMGGGPTANATTTNSFSQQQQTSTTSPYHITMSNNQMTKLFLASPGQQSHLGHQHATGAFSVDNNYMPIATNSSLVCPPPTQDSDYQTIY